MSHLDLNSIGVLAQSAVSLKPDLLLIAALLGVALFIGLSVLLAQNWKHWSLKKLLVSIGNLVWVAPIFLAIGWVGLIVSPYLTGLDRDPHYQSASSEFQRNSVETASQFRPLNATDQLEPWVLSGQVDRGDVVEVPVHGGLRESEKEARKYAEREALRVVREDLWQAYPGTKSRGWGLPISSEQVRLVPVEEIEVQKVDLGSMERNMYRAHLLVELSESQRQEILQKWMPRVQEFRLFLMSLVAGMLTICSVAGATCLRLDLKTEGKFRTWLRLATICVVLASTLATQNILAQAEFHTLTGIEIQSATADNSA